MDAPLVLAFLDHLEKDRNNSIRSRNARLAAVRSFLRFAAWKDPEALAMIQRVLAIPMKRCDRSLVGFLSREVVQAIINAPDVSTLAGTARLSSLVYALQHRSPRVGGEGNPGSRLDVGGQPLCSSSRQRPQGPNCAHLAGYSSSDSSLAYLHRFRARQAAVSGCQWRSSHAVGGHGSAEARHGCRLRNVRQIGAATSSPPTCRHTTAMHLLQSGVDITLIAFWLARESGYNAHLC